ncbi:MAG: tetratricopeptide repeat protein [Burkholderiales bacterium]|nr:tetratricopeptide repeat protein [Burkholderiales bacterium]
MELPNERLATAVASHITLFIGLLALLFSFHPASAAHAAIGTPVANAEMPTPEGGRARVLQPAETNVLVFFRPNQERSLEALRELALCQKGFDGKSARWAAIVSDSVPVVGAAAMLRESGFAAPLLIDTGDALYGSLGIALHPVVVIVDKENKLAAFEPFRAVNFCAVVGAHLRYVLREISMEEMRAALDPPKAVEGGNGQVARRYRALAKALLKSGKLEKALEYAHKSVELDPAFADGHATIGEILRVQEKCADAMPAYDRALALDAANATAAQGRKRCAPAR